MTFKTMTTPNHQTKRKVSPLLDWYQRTTGNLVDRMCCVSYASQVDDGEESVEYDAIRSKMMIPAWVEEARTTYDHQQEPNKHQKANKGHLTLQGDADGVSMGKCYFSPCSPSDKSVATATTVSTSTVRTASRTLASQSTINTSNRSNRSNEHVVVDDVVYIRNGSTTPAREIDVPSKYRDDARRESPPPLQSVPSDALPNLPYLTLTEGYEC